MFFNDKSTRMNPRGRWRRSRNLRRVPTTEEAGVGEGSKFSPLRRRHCSKSPLLEVIFLDIAFIIASGRLKKVPTKKKTDTRQTDLSRSRGRLDPVFRHRKRSDRSKKPSKSGPESRTQIPLTSRLMGTSGFLGRWHSPQIAPAAQKTANYCGCAFAFSHF